LKEEGKELFLTYTVPSRLLQGKQVTEIELVPSPYENNESYKLVIKHLVTLPTVQSTNDLRKASIDLGVVNLVTLFSPCMERPIIYSGKPVTGLNKKYNHWVDSLKSSLKQKWNKTTCARLQAMLTRRTNKIDAFFENVSSSVMDYCTKYNISELIIGYNKNWKTSVNIGRTNNRKFYEIPYRRLVSKLFDKGESKGVKVVENEESYTSKCDALGLEDIRHHDEYMGKRVKRGLFSSSAGVLLNADVNGAINIMRKHVYKAYSALSETLNSTLRNIPVKQLCNPLVLFRKLARQDFSFHRMKSSESNRVSDHPWGGVIKPSCGVPLE